VAAGDGPKPVELLKRSGKSVPVLVAELGVSS
jgi:hypothetical protein